MDYCAHSQSKHRKEAVTLLQDMQIKSAHVDKLGLSHICNCLLPSKLEKGQCFLLFRRIEIALVTCWKIFGTSEKL